MGDEIDNKVKSVHSCVSFTIVFVRLFFRFFDIIKSEATDRVFLWFILGCGKSHKFRSKRVRKIEE